MQSAHAVAASEHDTLKHLATRQTVTSKLQKHYKKYRTAI